MGVLFIAVIYSIRSQGILPMVAQNAILFVNLPRFGVCWTALHNAFLRAEASFHRQFQALVNGREPYASYPGLL